MKECVRLRKKLRRMSQNDETASSAEQGASIIDSVFDFLYHDARRIGSFIAQIDPAGHLTSLKQIEAVETGSGMDFNASTSGTIAIARAGAALQDRRTASERESLERTYDPLWTNALSLLDMLDERQMIHDGLVGARIGQFVKISGSLTVTDLTLWKGLWSMPALKEVMSDSVTPDTSSQQQRNRAGRRKHEATRSAPNQKTTLEHQMDAALGLIGMLPHTIQARIITDDGTSAWCSLREDGLVVSASDLTLKHGTTVSGRWTMVGVLDALAEIGPDGLATQSALDARKETQAVGVGPMGDLMQSLTPAIRGLLGRPNQAHGITPLVIFRKINV